ncbi:pyocin knob domain-containing protein [Treponema pectinovorum]|uniref:pyocin knob domain-containing protein n=1 Tax=Treponema pectinovorum TaxID=164 RepID=UPI0011C8D50F|nr:pyocin knob domain-containing protein [Treponema pectinovorum]
MAQINYTTLNQLDEGTQINDRDFIYLKGAGEDGADFKAKAKTLKDFSRPENASADSGGLLTKLEQEIAGLKKFISGLEAQFASIKNDLSVQGSATIQGNLDISGDLRVKGKSKKIASSTLEIANNEIITRAESQSALGAGEYTGIRAKNYDGKNDGRLVFGRDGVARVGDEGQEQALATREDSPRNKSLAVWDASENRYKSIALGNEGDLLESKGEGNLPQFATHPKINVKSITQTVTSTEDGGENEITCELTNGVKTTFTVRNGTKGERGEIDSSNIDTEPKEGSSNLITSGGVAKALGNKLDKKTIDTEPTKGSENLITSGAVKNALENYEKKEVFKGDLNNLKDNGFYLIDGTSTNAPNNSYAIVKVYNNGWYVQEWYSEFHSTERYYRTSTDGTGWSNWQQIALKSDLSNCTKIVKRENGIFDNLCSKEDVVWLVVVQRISIHDGCAVMVHKHGNVMSVLPIIKSDSFSYETNSRGTITFKYNGSNEGISGFAIPMNT